MATFDWWRSWHGAPMDHKWPVIAAKAGVKVGIVSAVAWAVMDYASQHQERGTVTGFDEESYAIYSGFPESEIHAVIVAMTDKGFIESGHLRNWMKRQPKREGDSSERVARYREMKRNVTQCNTEAEDVTFSSSLLLSDSLSSSDSLTLNSSQEKRPEIFSIYEREIGALTGAIAEELLSASDDYPEGWIADALKESARQNKRSWAYAKAILKRWKVEGRGDKKPAKPATRILYDPDNNPVEVEA